LIDGPGFNNVDFSLKCWAELFDPSLMRPSILGAIAFIILQTVIIIVLLLSRAKQRRAEDEGGFAQISHPAC
jgi:hypothetical protein